MSDRSWSDEELDAYASAELSRMAGANPAPAVRDVRGSRRVRGLPPLPWSAAPDRPRRLAPLAAALGVAVVFAGAGAWFGTHRSGGNVAQPAHGAPTPRPAPPGGATLHSTVPAGVKVVYYATQKPTDRDAEFEAVDWSGRRVGHLSVVAGSDPVSVDQSPDGQMLVVGSDVFTAQGSWLGRNDAYSSPFVWADDGRSICYNATPPAQSGPASSLVVYSPDRGARIVTQLQEAGVIACSISQDRAIVVTDFGINGNTSSVSVYRLSTGARIARHDYCTTDCSAANTPRVYQASRDAATVIEESGGLTLRNLVTGTVTPLHSNGRVVNFSWDGTRVVVETRSGTLQSGFNLDIDVLDAKSGRLVWHREETGTQGWDGELAPNPVEPGGSRVVVTSQPSIQSSVPGRLELVDAGSSTPSVHLVTSSLMAVASR